MYTAKEAKDILIDSIRDGSPETKNVRGAPPLDQEMGKSEIYEVRDFPGGFEITFQFLDDPLKKRRQLVYFTYCDALKWPWPREVAFIDAMMEQFPRSTWINFVARHPTVLDRFTKDAVVYECCPISESPSLKIPPHLREDLEGYCFQQVPVRVYSGKT